MILKLLLGLVVISTGYHLFSVGCALAFRRWRQQELRRAAKRPPLDEELPPVSILKPLRGADDQTFENLATFCRLDYPRLQILFGVADPNDPAIPVVTRLRQAFPKVDIELVISDHRIGSNAKVSNLENMLHRARYDTLAIADSDIRIPSEALRILVPYLAEPGVGLSTCLYRAIGERTLANRIEGLFVNTDFAPMVTAARIIEKQRYAFGATICMRRRILDEIGGFRAIADHLADDYQLGYLADLAGYRSVLAPVLVETCLDLDDLSSMASHQLRWARTYRVCRPVSYFGLILTHATLWATLFSLATLWQGAFPLVGLAAIGVRTAVGLYLANVVLDIRDLWRHAWLIPVKDLFLSAIFALAFLGNKVRWGDTVFSVSADGRMTPIRKETVAEVVSSRAAA